MSYLDHQIASLTQAQRRLLTSVLGGAARSGASAHEEAPPDGVPTTMSHAQRRLWLVDSLATGTAFNVPIVHRISGPLAPDALETALRVLIDRHAALRTVFPEDADGPLQLVTGVPDRVLTRYSVVDQPEHTRAEAAMRLVRAEAARPFDLRTGPVLRSCVVQAGPQDWLFLLCIHHIACDQWSMGVFMQELQVCYDAARAGARAQLPPVGRSYAQYSVQQRRVEEEGGFRRGLAYWGSQLSGMTPLTLPTDRPRPARSAQRGAETARWLTPTVTEQVRRTAAASGASPFMVVLAAFVVLMRSYGRTEDVAVGSTTAGRDDDALAGVVGFFVNTVVLRVQADGGLTFAELLARVRTTVLEGHLHAAVPFELVVDTLDPDRAGASPPLTPVLCQQDNTPEGSLQLPGCQVALVDDFDPGTSKYDLLVSVRTRREGTRLHLQYDTELFNETTAGKLLDGFEACLTSAVQDPHVQVADLPVMGAAELADLQQRNATDVDLRVPATLHDALLQTARRRPDGVALVEADGSTVTFAQLVDRAQQLAGGLRAHGVSRLDRVGVQLTPGADYLVAVLGTLLIGAVFVPIDPQYPAARIDQVHTAAGIALTVGSGHVTVQELTAAGTGSAGPSSSPVGAADPAYVIYTSGSTGEPKGVVVTHGGILNNLEDLRRRLSLGPGDAVLALSSPSFDMSVFELLGLPLSGGTVVTVDPELSRDPGHWEEMALAHEVTVWNSAPALLDMFLTHLEGSGAMELPRLREAVLGGDWVPLPLARRWQALFPGTGLRVLGGATEASIHSTFFTVERIDPHWRSIPYGRPMANQRTVVVDEAGHLCPVGVPGDLLIGGAGLAAGYLGRPDLTAEKFVHLFGQRWYRTGDLARWLADGELELLGRTDLMVKINGLRIEPAEVEAAIGRVHPVDGVAVVSAQDAVGDHRLVAYLRSDVDLPVAQIRSRLTQVLPAYMVPAEIIRLAAFPLSPNGKVDRRALQRLTTRSAEPATPRTPPRTATEARVASVWAEVLGVAEVGRDDDFFDLGGDSFKAVRAVRAIDADLPAIAIFRHSTVAGLAAYVDHELVRSGRRSRLVRLSDEPPHGSRPTLVCLPYGGGNAIAYQPLAEALRGQVDVWAVDLPGHDLSDGAALRSITEVARECAAEISERRWPSVMVYGQCAGCAAAVELVRALERVGVEVPAAFVGAALPDSDPASSMRLVRDADDGLLLGHMRGLGGFEGVLSDDDVDGILRVVRHDLRQMVEMYLREWETPPPAARAPFHCIIGSEDPATPGYGTRFADWGRYGSSVTLSVIDGGDHYFCKHKPQELAALVLQRITPVARPEGHVGE